MSALGALLAGGRSRRMGTDKALLPVGQGTLLDYMAARLRALPLDEVIICRDAPGCLADPIPGLGPLGALSALGTAYPGREILVVPVDMPLLSATTLLALLGGNGRPQHYADRFLPLRLAMDSATIAAIAPRASPQAADRSLAGLLRALDARCLPAPAEAEAEFSNVNAPGDWARIRGLLPPTAGLQGL